MKEAFRNGRTVTLSQVTRSCDPAGIGYDRDWNGREDKEPGSPEMPLTEVGEHSREREQGNK